MQDVKKEEEGEVVETFCIFKNEARCRGPSALTYYAPPQGGSPPSAPHTLADPNKQLETIGILMIIKNYQFNNFAEQAVLCIMYYAPPQGGSHPPLTL